MLYHGYNIAIKGVGTMGSVAVHITVPEELLREVDKQAKREHRNRSELWREAMRQYLENQRRKVIEEQRLKHLLQALERSAGSWSDEAHPELKRIEDARRLRERLWEADQRRLERGRG
jgi:Arc/MetJ-type ribon-helix-helix transcriptional regulator